LPRGNIAAIEAWRTEFRAQEQVHAVSQEKSIQRWSAVVLIVTALYVFIGPTPYKHGLELDAATGGAAISPINRYIWMAIGGMCLPILWQRRRMLIPALKALWVVLALYVWFFLTTTWALDPSVAGRRLFLSIINLVIALSLAIGFSDTRKAHVAFAYACLAIVAIDFLSWMIAPGLSMTEIGLAAIHSHKNTMGLVMMVAGLVIGPMCLAPPDPRYRWVWIGAFLAALAMLWASQSKTSLGITIAALALTPVIMVVLRQRTQAVSAILLSIIAVTALAVLGWLAYCTVDQIDPLGPITRLTFTGRTDLWAFVLGEVAKRPVTGAGFGSFWDIDPRLQPSLLATDLSYGSSDLVNESHNGYLDLLATTGVIGLVGGLFLLLRWIGRGFAQIRWAVRQPGPVDRQRFYAFLVFGLFPTLVFAHNFMESSYFTANALLGQIVLIAGVDIDVFKARRDGKFGPA
jgi:O-antigen ligase